MDSSKRVFRQPRCSWWIGWFKGFCTSSSNAGIAQTASEVKEIVDRLESQHTYPDGELIINLIQVSGNSKTLSVGKQVHRYVVRGKYDRSLYICNILIKMYSKCESPDDARQVFDGMQRRNVITWTSMLSAYTKNGQHTDALRIYQQMLLNGERPNKITILAIIDACLGIRGTLACYLIHENAVESSYASDAVVGAALVNMFGKRQNVEAARSVFDKIHERNVVAWTAMIAAYIGQGDCEEAFVLYDQMQMEKVNPNAVTFITILEGCNHHPEALKLGKRIHLNIITSELELDVVVATALINMYSRCGCLKDARKIFEKLPHRDAICWNTMIAACAESGNCTETFYMFRMMLLEGIRFTKVTFINLLNACSSPAALAEGKLVHAYVTKCQFGTDIVLGTALMNMYGKCGSLEDAQLLFTGMLQRSVVSWNAMFGLYADHDQCEAALCLFKQMGLEGVKPDELTFLAVLNVCTSSTVFKWVKELHSCIAECEFASAVAVNNAVIDTYAKCGSLEAAQNVFDSMPKWDVISWTSMIGACFQHGQHQTALQLFHQMHIEAVIPDRVTFTTILYVCANLNDLKQGKMVHSCIEARGLPLTIALGAALVNMYGKCGDVQAARVIFDEMREKDTLTWNAMLAAYAYHGGGKEALKLFGLMQQEQVKPDAVTLVIVLSACNHAGLVNQALQCFVSMLADYGVEPIAEHHGCMIDLLAKTGRLSEAECLIGRAGVAPDPLVWSALLGACRVHGNTGVGIRAAENVLQSDPNDGPTYIALSNIYADRRCSL